MENYKEHVERQLDAVQIDGKKLREMSLEECREAIVRLDDAFNSAREKLRQNNIEWP